MASMSSMNSHFSNMLASLVFLAFLVQTLDLAGGQSIGICYGTHADNLPSEQETINMYKSLNIKKMRLYNENRSALDALKGTDIELMLGVPNEKIQQLASTPGDASSWVRDNIISYHPAVRFKYIAVGNEEIPTSYTAQFILPAMRNIYSAIQAAGLQDQIKVSTVIHSAVTKDSWPPSRTTFTDEAATYLGPISSFLSDTGAPLLANIYPYFSYRGDHERGENNIPLPYALFTYPEVRFTDENGGHQYRNLFDALVDSLYWSLEKVGAANVKIVVSESGWPSDGGYAASIENARTYNQRLIGHVRGGTPKRPQPVETYVFGMFNENLKTPPGVENNFGLFYPDQRPVYSINFAG